MHIQFDPASEEEPTWEVRRPGASRKQRFDGRTRSILTAAAVAAVVVNAGAAWAYWRVAPPEATRAEVGRAVELVLHARSDPHKPLRPGGTGDLTVTVTNDYDVPIRITSIAPGVGGVVTDTEHRNGGCRAPAVEVSRPAFPVSWDVPRNAVGAFTIPGGLSMQHPVDPACMGAAFVVPVQARGVRVEAS